MDFTSVLVGFLVGTATGAAGSYFATKFTEQRHKKESTLSYKTTLINLESEMPALLSDFRNDFSDPENGIMREFYLLSKSNVLNVKGNYLAYYYDDHPKLKSMIKLLETEGLVDDVTETNTVKYMFNNEFVKYLKNEI
jgi:hypothetical protein